MAPELPSLSGLFDAIAFRYSAYDTPLWARDNRDSGRWHKLGDGATQYMSLSPDGAWAELARAESLKTDEDLELVRMPIWSLRLNEQTLVDYSSFDLAEAAGMPPEALVDDDYSRCQAEGRRLRDLGYSGVVALSAALPGAVNITLFGRRMLSSWTAPTRLASSIPGCVVAVGGPPPGLARRVRHFGQRHESLSTYIAWCKENAQLEHIRSNEPDDRHPQLRRGDDETERDSTGGNPN